MQRYIAFLRGVNVGGNGLIKMTELKECLGADGLHEVQTYIQSGNIIFSSTSSNKKELSEQITQAIKRTFHLDVAVAVFTAAEWHAVIAKAPKWWGKNSEWKHNILILTETVAPAKVVEAIGILKPAIEAIEPGKGVVYQSVSFTDFGKATSGKLASNPIYKKMTVRNFNTANKLVGLVSAAP